MTAAYKTAVEDELLRVIPEEAWNLLLDGHVFQAVVVTRWHSVDGPLSLAQAIDLINRANLVLGIGPAKGWR